MTPGPIPIASMPAPAMPLADAIVTNINTSPVFIGSMMLLMNLGARFLPAEITRAQESFLSHPYFRRFLIFVILFIATRNVVYAFWLSILVILVIGYLFNENSALCLFRGGESGATCSSVPGPAPTVGGMIGSAAAGAAAGLTPEEADIFRKLSEKQAKAAQMAAAGQKAQAGSTAIDGSSHGQQKAEASNISKYYANLSTVRGAFGF
jgi:hypothetical protein